MSDPTLEYTVVDVFTDRAYAGNPLAVVHGSEGLATEQLHAIAREFNLSETTFPQPVDASSYRVRIFTPETELPFAGHPTIGTAWVLTQRGELGAASVVQHCGDRQVEVRLRADGAELAVRPSELSGSLDLPWLLAAAGVAEGDLQGPVRAASCGLGFLYARVLVDAVRRSRPPGSSWRSPATGLSDPVGGLCVYAVEGSDAGVLRVTARVYCPEAGVPEDPATGSAAAALGLVLAADGLTAADGGTAYVVSQGEQLRRPSVLRCRVEVAGGVAQRVHVGGGVVPVARGTLTPPARP